MLTPNGLIKNAFRHDNIDESVRFLLNILLFFEYIIVLSSQVSNTIKLF